MKRKNIYYIVIIFLIILITIFNYNDIVKNFNNIVISFNRTLIEEDRYLLMLEGLKSTLVISIFSIIFGTVIAFVIFLMRVTKLPKLSKFIVSLLQGTPCTVLLLILYYVVFGKVNIEPLIVAIIAFSIYFAAYVSEIIRGAYNSLNKNQILSAYSLGFNKVQTFKYVILPQVLTYTIPVYKNECISLIKMTSIAGYISIMDLTKSSDISKYYKNNMIFNNINLTVNKGEVVSIIGKSGCGKSSLLKCINKLEKIQQGKIFIYNHDVENIKVEDLRKRVGIVFQDYNLFSHLTVIENLTIGLMKLKKMTKSESIKKAEEILKKIDLIDKKNNYPDELSGGQQQRVAIARTILMKPNLILLDEPTSALDKESKNSVFDMIKELVKENMTMIIVSHEEQFVEEISDRIFKLNKHELKEMKK